MVVNSSTRPLQVVLGSLASPTNHTECAAEPDATTVPSILATSAYPRPESALKLKIDGRVPMEDRKTSLSQFLPRALLLSVSESVCIIWHQLIHYHLLCTKQRDMHSKSHHLKCAPTGTLSNKPKYRVAIRRSE